MKITLRREDKTAPDAPEDFSPSLPRVDLFPPSVRETTALRRTRTVLLVLLGVVALLGATIWVLQGSAIGQAEARLADAQAENSRMQAQIDLLAPITVLFDEIANQRALVETTLAAQPRAAAVNDRLIAAGGPGVDFSFITVEYQPIPVAGEAPNLCPNPNPFDSRVAIGCLSFSATATNPDQVSALLLALEADPFFIGPYVGSTSSSEGKVTFSGTVAVSTDALVTPLSDEALQAILTGAQPSEATAQPSTSPGATP